VTSYRFKILLLIIVSCLVLARLLIPDSMNLTTSTCLSLFRKKILEKKAASGDYDAAMSLFNHYAICKQDSKTGLKWIEPSANKGNPYALFSLGSFTEPIDKKKSCEWYLKSAESGDVQGMLETGNCYRSGKGFEKDLSESIKWYQKAAERNLDDAYIVLGEIYSSESPEVRDDFKAYVNLSIGLTGINYLTELIAKRDKIKLKLNENELRKAEAIIGHKKIKVTDTFEGQ